MCCKSNQNASEGNEKSNKEELVQKGYEKVTVLKTMENTSCPFILQLENYTKLDPINLEDKYKEEGIVMWIKYHRLRMPQRC